MSVKAIKIEAARETAAAPHNFVLADPGAYLIPAGVKILDIENASLDELSSFVTQLDDGPLDEEDIDAFEFDVAPLMQLAKKAKYVQIFCGEEAESAVAVATEKLFEPLGADTETDEIRYNTCTFKIKAAGTLILALGS